MIVCCSNAHQVCIKVASVLLVTPYHRFNAITTGNAVFYNHVMIGNRQSCYYSGLMCNRQCLKNAAMTSSHIFACGLRVHCSFLHQLLPSDLRGWTNGFEVGLGSKSFFDVTIREKNVNKSILTKRFSYTFVKTFVYLWESMRLHSCWSPARSQHCLLHIVDPKLRAHEYSSFNHQSIMAIIRRQSYCGAVIPHSIVYLLIICFLHLPFHCFIATLTMTFAAMSCYTERASCCFRWRSFDHIMRSQNHSF